MHRQRTSIAQPFQKVAPSAVATKKRKPAEIIGRTDVSTALSGKGAPTDQKEARMDPRLNPRHARPGSRHVAREVVKARGMMKKTKMVDERDHRDTLACLYPTTDDEASSSWKFHLLLRHQRHRRGGWERTRPHRRRRPRTRRPAAGEVFSRWQCPRNPWWRKPLPEAVMSSRQWAPVCAFGHGRRERR